MKTYGTGVIILVLYLANYAYPDFNPYIEIQNRSSHIICFTSD